MELICIIACDSWRENPPLYADIFVYWLFVTISISWIEMRGDTVMRSLVSILMTQEQFIWLFFFRYGKVIVYFKCYLLFPWSVLSSKLLWSDKHYSTFRKIQHDGAPFTTGWLNEYKLAVASALLAYCSYLFSACDLNQDIKTAFAFLFLDYGT